MWCCGWTGGFLDAALRSQAIEYSMTALYSVNGGLFPCPPQHYPAFHVIISSQLWKLLSETEDGRVASRERSDGARGF